MYKYYFTPDNKHTSFIMNEDIEGQYISILYEDYEGKNVKCLISSNISNIYNKNIIEYNRIVNEFIKILSYHKIEKTIPDYILDYIINEYNKIFII